MRRRTSLIAAFLMLTSPLLAQTRNLAPASAATAGPAKASPSTGPSLEETEQFITEKVKGEGHIFSKVVFQYEIKNAHNTVTTTVDADSDIDFNLCQFHRIHYSSNPNGNLLMISLKDIDGIEIKSDQDDDLADVRLDAAKADALGDPQIVIPQTPPLYDVFLKIKPSAVESAGGASEVVRFRERDVAARVAKAFAHAIALCGGGQKEAF